MEFLTWKKFMSITIVMVLGRVQLELDIVKVKQMYLYGVIDKQEVVPFDNSRVSIL